MLLESLKIVSNGTVLREVVFKKGINLIIDGSVKENTETGNSVGKTTALRAIDYCFGARLNAFYEDQEFKTDNEKIRGLFANNNVEFYLTINTDVGRSIRIIRTASVEGAFSAYIDADKFESESEFHLALKERIFFSSARKPTIRQIMSRYIRNSQPKMTNALKTLHQATTKSEYETLNLYLFGFGDPAVLVDKQELDKRLKKHKGKLQAFKQEYSKEALRQSLAVLNRDIEAKESEIKEFRIGESYKQQEQELETLREKISSTMLSISALQVRLTMNREVLDNLHNSKEDIDPVEIREIYDEASVRLGKLSKTFEDVLRFHNGMIDKKLAFVGRTISTLEQNVNEYRAKADVLLEREKQLLEEVGATGSLADLELMQRQLNELYETKGRSEQALETILDIEKKIDDASIELALVVDKLNANKEDFGKKLNIFNEYFSKFTRLMYEEEYVLYFEESGGQYEFKISPVNVMNRAGNVGEGMKKALVSAFDFAYISFLNRLNSRGIKFVAHDGIEAIHENQVRTLFDVGSKLDGQYIVSTLRKTVEFLGGDFVNENRILELDENNKFFKVS